MDRFGSALVGITGNDAIHVVSGGRDPHGGIWISSRIDYSATWRTPRRLLTDCLAALDLDATPSGQIVNLANCATAQHARTAIVIRLAAGRWRPPQFVPMDGWTGAIAVAGDRQDLRITALTLPFAGARATVGHLIGKDLVYPGSWQVRDVPLIPAGVPGPGALRWQPHQLSFTRRLPSGAVRTGLIFTWSDAERAHAYAITSLDGGVPFGPVAPIVVDDTVSGMRSAPPATFAAPAYDPIADRLVAIWTLLPRGLVCAGAGHALRQLERAGQRALDAAAGHESHPDDYRLALGPSHGHRAGADVAPDMGGLGGRAERDHGAVVRSEHDYSDQSLSDADTRRVRWCMWPQSSRNRILAGIVVLLLLIGPLGTPKTVDVVFAAGAGAPEPDPTDEGGTPAAPPGTARIIQLALAQVGKP